MTDPKHSTRIQSLLLHWKTLLAIGLVVIAVVLELLFIWGIFFWFWAIENLRSGEAYFVERVNKADEPVLYWLIIVIWIFMGSYYFFLDENIYSFLF